MDPQSKGMLRFGVGLWGWMVWHLGDIRNVLKFKSLALALSCPVLPSPSHRQAYCLPHALAVPRGPAADYKCDSNSPVRAAPENLAE